MALNVLFVMMQKSFLQNANCMHSYMHSLVLLTKKNDHAQIGVCVTLTRANRAKPCPLLKALQS